MLLNYSKIVQNAKFKLEIRMEPIIDLFHRIEDLTFNSSNFKKQFSSKPMVLIVENKQLLFIPYS